MNVELCLTFFQLIFEADQSSKCQNDHHTLFLLNFWYQQLYCDVVEIWQVNCQHDGQRYMSLEMLHELSGELLLLSYLFLLHNARLKVHFPFNLDQLHSIMVFLVDQRDNQPQSI